MSKKYEKIVYSTNINNLKAMEWGLKPSEAALFDQIVKLGAWAKSIQVDNDLMYYFSRNEVCKQLPLYFKQPDTVYRAYKSLKEKGLIFYKKFDEKDMVRLTKKGQEWIFNRNNNTSNDYKDTDFDTGNGYNAENARKNIQDDLKIYPTYNTTTNSFIIDSSTLEKMNKTQFKKFIIDNFSDLIFCLNEKNPCCFLESTEFAIIGGYIRNITASIDLSSADAIRIWHYLYEKKELVVDAMLQRLEAKKK